MKIEGDLCDRQAKLVFLVRQFNPIVLPGQDLTEDAESRPMVVVHHDAAHTPSPGPHCRNHLFRKSNWQRSDRLNRKAASKPASWIGFVELFGEGVGGGAL